MQSLNMRYHFGREKVALVCAHHVQATERSCNSLGHYQRDFAVVESAPQIWSSQLTRSCFSSVLGVFTLLFVSTLMNSTRKLFFTDRTSTFRTSWCNIANNLVRDWGTPTVIRDSLFKDHLGFRQYRFI